MSSFSGRKNRMQKLSIDNSKTAGLVCVYSNRQTWPNRLSASRCSLIYTLFRASDYFLGVTNWMDLDQVINICININVGVIAGVTVITPATKIYSHGKPKRYKYISMLRKYSHRLRSVINTESWTEIVRYKPNSSLRHWDKSNNERSILMNNKYS